MGRKKTGPRSKVFLVCYSADGNVIQRVELSYDEYYEGTPAVMDSDDFRSQRGVRRLTGEIYNSTGNLQQSFDNTYDEKGRYVRSRIVYEDGTVIED